MRLTTLAKGIIALLILAGILGTVMAAEFPAVVSGPYFIGAKWYNGTATPDSGLGVNGDYYLNVTDGDIWQKSEGAWSLISNIIGPRGFTGEKGEPGSPGGTGGTTYFFAKTIDPSTGYNHLGRFPSGLVESDTSAVADAGTGDVLIDTFITPPGDPAITVVPAGMRTLRIFGYVDALTGDSELVMKAYYLHQDGTESALILEQPSGNINALSTPIQPFTSFYARANDYYISVTDRLILRIYARSTSPTPVTVHLVTDGSYHASNLQTTFGESTLTSLSFPAIESGYSDLKRGQAVELTTGGTLGYPVVRRADNTVVGTEYVIGLVGLDTPPGGNTSIVRMGALFGVDDRPTNLDINPNGETWAAGDTLYLTTNGGLTNVRPTSGRTVAVAHSLVGSSDQDTLFVDPIKNPVWITAASGENVVLRLGDNLNATSVSIRNYNNVEVASFSSGGLVNLTNSLNMNNNLISNVANPQSAQDAATKFYVDSQASGAINASFPGSSTNNDVVVFSGVSGHVVADSGHTLSEYLTTSSAASTYDTIANVSSHMAEGAASSTDQHIVLFSGTGGHTLVDSGHTLSEYLTSDTAPGSNGQVLYNGGGAEMGNASLTFNNATGTLSATYFSGDGSALTNIVASGTTFTVKEGGVGTISKGQAVYISGASGANHLVEPADNAVLDQSRVIGVVTTDLAKNAQGSVQYDGVLTNVDTRATNSAINPLGQTWNAGDLLFLTSTGGLTNIRPTSGRSVKVAYSLKGSNAADSLLVYVFENPVWITSASGENVVLRVGDNSGANKVSIRNYANTEVASINSYGIGTIITGTSGTSMVNKTYADSLTAGLDTIANVSSHKAEGAASSTSGNVVTFSGTSGHVLADSGHALSEYLTTSSASSTYDTIANVSSHKTEGIASSTSGNVVTWSGTGGHTLADSGHALSEYLTTSSASSTYDTIANVSSHKAEGAASSTSGNVVTFSGTGGHTLADSGHALSEYLTTSSASSTYDTIANVSSHKAEGIASSVNGNFVSWSGTGGHTLADSGYSGTSFETVANVSSHKAEGAASSTSGNVVTFSGTSGHVLADSGHALSEYLTTSSASSTYDTITNVSSHKTEGITSSTSGNIVTWSGTGGHTLADSGHALSEYLTTSSASSTYDTIANVSSHKAEGAASSTSGNVVTFSGTGGHTLADSGHALSEYLTTSSASSTYDTIANVSSHKAEGAASSTSGDFVSFSGTGGHTLADSSYSASSFETVANVSSHKVEGAASSTSGNIVTFSGTSGHVIADSGHALSEYLTTSSASSTYDTIANVSSHKTEGVASNTASDIVTWSGTGGHTLADSGSTIAQVQASDFNNDLNGVKGNASMGFAKNATIKSTANNLTVFTGTDGQTIGDAMVSNTSFETVANVSSHKVEGVASSTNNDIMVFSGTGGHTSADSGIPITQTSSVTNRKFFMSNVTVLKSGSGATFTLNSSTRLVTFEILGGGAGGGGAAGTSSDDSAGGGGGSGGYCQVTVTATPSSSVTFTVGGGGAGGVNTGGTGTGGTASSVTYSGTTYTGNGGSGGVGMTAGTSLRVAAGGAGAAVSTFCDVNGAGAPGEFGIATATVTVAQSGGGGSSIWGGGGVGTNAGAVGNPGVGYGAGGGGAATNSGATTSRVGGAGTAGVIVVTEYAT